MNILPNIINYLKYASYDSNLGRRQTKDEVVSSYIEMMLKAYPDLRDEIVQNGEYIKKNKIFPSMRGFQFSGLPIFLNPAKIYNCSYLAIDNYRSFNELLFLLLCGTGVGYSVQSHHVNKLPELRSPRDSVRYLIQDSVEGWCDALKYLLKSYFFGGNYPEFDYGDIRLKGAPIKKSGGISAGSEPLRKSLENVDFVLKNAIGRRLTTIEVHDICCFISECVYSGGIREAAMISLFDNDDESMIKSKSIIDIDSISISGSNDDGTFRCIVKSSKSWGKLYSKRFINLNRQQIDQIDKDKKIFWYLIHPQRSRSNNSGVFVRGQVTESQFQHYYKLIKDSYSGEPGIYWTNDVEIGTNPCGEISLNSISTNGESGGQFCNLTSINAGDKMTQEEFNNRAKAASFFGTLQAGFTDFHYIRNSWKKITENESLIGVSMTGICEGNVIDLDLSKAVKVINGENERISKIIGIPVAARTTCIKPEGTTTLMAGLTSSGIHASFSKYIKRAIRIKKHQPIYQVLVSAMPDLIEDCAINPSMTAIFYYPLKSSDDAILSNESSLDTLERIKYFYIEWIMNGHRSGHNTNNVSATVYVKHDEWDSVFKWLWNNRLYYSGITLLPYDDNNYLQAPFTKIDKSEYEKLKSFLVNIDFSKIKEDGDNTELISELACVGGSCEIV